MNSGPAGILKLDFTLELASIRELVFTGKLAGDSLSGFHDLSGQHLFNGLHQSGGWHHNGGLHDYFGQPTQLYPSRDPRDPRKVQKLTNPQTSSR